MPQKGFLGFQKFTSFVAGPSMSSAVLEKYKI